MDEKKTRIDAWDAALADETRWAIYDEARALRWPKDVCDYLEKRGVETLPSRSSWYKFLARMRKADATRRIEKIAQSVAEAQDVADRHGIKSAVFVETLKTLAIDKAMGGDDKAATQLAGAAAAIWDRAQKERELQLKAAAQQTKDEQLKLAREKFEAAERRENAAKATVADAKLTDEERMSKLREIYGI